LITLTISFFNVSTANAESINKTEFNAIFLRGGNASTVDLSRFAHGNPVLPGTYQVQININGKEVSRVPVLFVAQPGSHIALPCLDITLIKRLGLNDAELSEPARAELLRIKNSGCTNLSQVVSDSSVNFDFSNLNLNIVVPQIALLQTPRGYVNPELWSEGVTSASLAYNLNVFRSVNLFSTSTSSYLGMTSGVNLGSWQLRQRSAFNKQSNGSSSYQNIATYLLHDMPSLRSRMVIGDSFTEGNLFNSVSYRGLTIASEERMLPDSQRGYAPQVRGIARTNARVKISQNGNVLLETTVPPGQFEIDDLYPTGYGGNLQVTVYEADGSQQSFVVPYSTLIQLLRPGIWRYSATVAQTRDEQITDVEQFAQVGVQYGLNNLVTVYSGATVSSNYGAALVGVALNTPAGAFAVDVTQSRSKVVNDDAQTGNSFRLSYNKAIEQTGTNITLSAFHHTSEGYASFRDSLILRQASFMALEPNAISRPRNQFQLNLNQALGYRGGSLYVTGSKTGYWNHASSSLQLLVGYSNFFKIGRTHVNYSIALSRIKNDLTASTANTLLATLSFPLGTEPRSPQMTVQYTPNLAGSANESLQTTISGTADESNTINYSASTTQLSNDTAVSGAVQYLSPYSTLSTSASQGAQFSQQSVGASGGIVIHKGGITFANQLTDTFGIIEAPGAEGARIINTIGARIDSQGYGIVSYLNAYRMNRVSIDPEGVSLDVDFLSTSQQIAPRANASVLVRFQTQTGRAVIFKARQSDGSTVPFGAGIYDMKNSEIGIVGQGGQIMLRLPKNKDSLTAKWGSAIDEQCRFNYLLPPAKSNQNTLLRVDVVCSTP
jgi:outer membrane usher protein